jgi:hypothetical protein
MTVLINEIMTEVWDKSDDDNTAKMAVTIYKGASDSSEFETLELTAQEGIQITKNSEEDMFGFTEWHTASRLLFMDLPERVDEWAVSTIAKYIGMLPEQVKAVRLASIQAVGAE